MHAGSLVGKPLSERAYITPRFPNGLLVSDLRVASEEIQKETALAWFMTNLKPYELGEGPWFGLRGGAVNSAPLNTYALNDAGPRMGGLDKAAWAPSSLKADLILQEQFEGVIPPEIVQSIGDILGDHWMWTDPDVWPGQAEGGTPSTADLLADLNAVEETIRQLVPEHGGIGHNAQLGYAPLTSREQREALSAIERVRSALVAEPIRPEEAKVAAHRLAEIQVKLGHWALGQVNTFITETNKAFAQKMPYLLGMTVLGWYKLGDLLMHISQYLEHMLR